MHVLRHKEAAHESEIMPKMRKEKIPMLKTLTAAALLVFAALSGRPAVALDTLSVALTSKAFQYVPLVIAQDRGYMKDDGLDVKFAFMQNAKARCRDRRVQRNRPHIGDAHVRRLGRHFHETGIRR